MLVGKGAWSLHCKGAESQKMRAAVLPSFSLLLQVLNFEQSVTDITSRDVIEMMMITQYFDMLKDIGISNRNSTVFLPHSPANVADVAGQIRAGFMQAQAGSAGINLPGAPDGPILPGHRGLHQRNPNSTPLQVDMQR